MQSLNKKKKMLYGEKSVLVTIYSNIDAFNHIRFQVVDFLNDSDLKAHQTPICFSAEMKLSNIHKRNLPIFLVSDIFKGFKN